MSRFLALVAPIILSWPTISSASPGDDRTTRRSIMCGGTTFIATTRMLDDAVVFQQVGARLPSGQSMLVNLREIPVSQHGHSYRGSALNSWLEEWKCDKTANRRVLELLYICNTDMNEARQSNTARSPLNKSDTPIFKAVCWMTICCRRMDAIERSNESSVSRSFINKPRKRVVFSLCMSQHPLHRTEAKKIIAGLKAAGFWQAENSVLASVPDPLVKFAIESRKRFEFSYYFGRDRLAGDPAVSGSRAAMI